MLNPKNKDEKGGAEVKKVWEMKQKSDTELELYIYGDVEGDYFSIWEGIIESDTSADYFRKELGKYEGLEKINVFINSYGGSVFEGTAIYSQLKRHDAQVHVYIDGFACSVASVIAMAGDKVIMPSNAMMMIHDAWLCACGNAKELRKAAEDLDVIMEGNRQAYLKKSNGKVEETELIQLLENETWLTAKQCVEYGFADEIADEKTEIDDTIVQKMNKTVEQQIEFNRALARQKRELMQSLKDEAEEKGLKEGPQEPKKNQTKKLFTALFSAERENENV